MASRLLLGAESLEQDTRPIEQAGIFAKNKSNLVYEYHAELKDALEGEPLETKDARAFAYQNAIAIASAESAIALKQRKGGSFLINLV